MVTEEQRSWLCDKCDAILVAADTYKLTEHDAELLIGMANKYNNQAKGNPIVKKALLETITYIEHMNQIMRGK